MKGVVTLSKTVCDLYLRLSDLRTEESLEGREEQLRTKAESLGWEIDQVIRENDIRPDGSPKPASAWKRVNTGRQTENGRPIYRVLRPGWRKVIAGLETGRITGVLAEDLDRSCRDMADLLDLLDAIGACKGNARSLTGSLRLTDGGTSDERVLAQFLVTVAGKASADTARRVAGGRERWAGKSYQGGRRPFGYRVAAGTQKYHRTLVIDKDEAAVIRQAATDILDRDISLEAAVRDLNARGVPTVTGAKWTTKTLRGALVKPAVSGLAVYRGEDERPAPWPAILDPEVRQRLADLFAEPSRRIGHGTNEPRHLVSLIALCGICADGTLVRANGGGTGKPQCYGCRNGYHLRRQASHVDDYVASVIINRLSLPDAGTLLRPPPRAALAADVKKLRAEAKELQAQKLKQVRMHARREIDDADLREGRREIVTRLTEIERQIAGATDEPDPLAEFRGRPALAVWKGLTIARRRAIVRLMVTVTLLPSRRGGAPTVDPVTGEARHFHPDSVRVEWLPGVEPKAALDVVVEEQR
jgi:DNA invertase Pin-like site-specific DNA recombinase